MAKLPVVGGPADGCEITRRTEIYVWLNVDGVRSGFPRPGAALYQRCDGAYVFCEHHVRQCPGCLGIVLRVEPSCPMCGAGV